MVSHALYPALDEDMPASLSHTIIQQWLKQKLGFEGLVISDDLEMGAVASFDSDGGAAIAAIHAGCDLLIYGNQEAPALRAKEALIRTASKDSAFKERLSQAASRVEQMVARWPAATAMDPKGAKTAWFEAVKADPLLRA